MIKIRVGEKIAAINEIHFKGFMTEPHIVHFSSVLSVYRQVSQNSKIVLEGTSVFMISFGVKNFNKVVWSNKTVRDRSSV